MLEEAKTHLSENETSLLKQVITLINHALAHTQPEPSLSPSLSPSPLLEEKFAIFIISLNERLGRIKTILAFKSFIGSQASQSGLINIPMFYITAVNYKGTSSSDRTNNGFIII
jgi:hypothetical protein